MHRGFPEHTEAIEALRRKDPIFGEICADYEEACSWLAGHCRSADRASEECDATREVIRNLEEEIRRVLSSPGSKGGKLGLSE